MNNCCLLILFLVVLFFLTSKKENYYDGIDYNYKKYINQNDLNTRPIVSKKNRFDFKISRI